MILKNISQNINLFWYFKEDAQLDLQLDWTKRIYIKEVLTNGNERDLREIFKHFNEKEIKDVFDDVKRFIPERVRSLWEGYFERTLGDNPFAE